MRDDAMIPLHKERGLDPHLTRCPRCGGPSNDLTVGAITVAHVPGDPDSHITMWSTGQGEKVRRELHAKGIDYMIRPARDGEVLPGGPCDACQKEMDAHAAIVRSGGIYFKCDECGRRGVVKPSPFATAVREKADVKTPDPVGLAFDHCYEHDGGAE